MSQPHDPQRETPRDAAAAGETARAENDARSIRVTEDGITEVGFDDPELRPLPPDQLHYHVPHPDAHPESHEHSDVPIRPLGIALAATAGTILLTIGLLYWVFWSFKGQQDRSEIPRTAIDNVKPVVPGPRLQGVPSLSDNHPTDDMNEQRARDRAALGAYGPNGTTQTARIPIERAMDLALERKMFPVAAATPGAGTGTGPSAGGASRQGAANVQGATSQGGPRPTTRPAAPQGNTQNARPQGGAPGANNPAQRPTGQGGTR